MVWYSLLNVVQGHSKSKLNRYVKQTSSKSFNSISTFICTVSKLYQKSKVGHFIPTWIGIGVFLLVVHIEWYLLVDFLMNKPFLHFPRYPNVLGEIIVTKKCRANLEVTNLFKQLTALERLTSTVEDTMRERLSTTALSNQGLEKYEDGTHNEKPEWLINLMHEQAYFVKQPCIEDSYGVIKYLTVT